MARKHKGGKQKGGTALYGPTIKGLEEQGGWLRGNQRPPHGPPTSTCNNESPDRPRLPMLGGGLMYSDFNGAGHRDILNHPGYGYSSGDNNALFKGSRPTTSSYNVSSCKGGAKKKKRKSKKLRKKRTRKRRKTRRKKSIKKRRRRKRRTRKNIKKRARRRKQSGCGQKGGALTTYSFPGKFDSGLGDYRLTKGHGIETNAYNNCFDSYNHYTKN
jgi:hypothetical protein